MSTKLQEESSDDDKMVARKGKRGLSLESEHNVSSLVVHDMGGTWLTSLRPQSDDVPVSAPAASTPKETKKKQVCSFQIFQTTGAVAHKFVILQGKKVKKDRKTYTEMVSTFHPCQPLRC